MPQTLHIERHFTGSETVRDVVIGMSDGLTVPFALAAGLSGAINTTSIIVTAGLAEITAGSIAMGLGGYLAAKSDAEHYFSERVREELEVNEKPEVEADEVAEVFQSYGLTAEESKPIVDALRKRPQAWIDFMMRFELGLEKPDPKRAFISAATIAGACSGSWSSQLESLCSRSSPWTSNVLQPLLLARPVGMPCTFPSSRTSREGP
jgi:VIT1/CCC1 family predicted Fe2+/Mn2+ transporter